MDPFPYFENVEINPEFLYVLPAVTLLSAVSSMESWIFYFGRFLEDGFPDHFFAKIV